MAGIKKFVSQADRYRGCLLGLAVGDAVGTTLEFMPPDPFPPLKDMVGGGPFKLKPGEWTDDTSMALCLADSLTACRGFDAHDQMERYVRWWKEGYMSSTGRCFDIGTITRTALEEFINSGEPMAGSVALDTAGNGSLMRLAPVPMAYARNPQEAIHFAGESSRTTHATATAVDACRYFAGLIVGAINGASKDELLSLHFCPISNFWKTNSLHRQIDEIASGSFKRKNPPEIRGTGFVVESLEAALWAFYRTENFRDGCLAAVNLGRDADTTGAIYGQIAGAFYGVEEIPAEWREKIAKKDLIESLAIKLLQIKDDPIGLSQFD